MVDEAIAELRAAPTVEGFVAMHRALQGSAPPEALDDALVTLTKSLEASFGYDTSPRGAPDGLVALRPVLASLPSDRRTAMFAKLPFRLVTLALLPAATETTLRSSVARLAEAQRVTDRHTIVHVTEDSTARIVSDVGDRLIEPLAEALASESTSPTLLVRCLARLRSAGAAETLVRALAASQRARILARSALIHLGRTRDGHDAVVSALSAGYGRAPKPQRALRAQALAALPSTARAAQAVRAEERDADLAARLDRITEDDQVTVSWSGREPVWQALDASDGAAWSEHTGLGTDELLSLFVSWAELVLIGREIQFSARVKSVLMDVAKWSGVTLAHARIVARLFTLMDEQKDLVWPARHLSSEFDRLFGSTGVDAITSLLDRGAPCARSVMLAHIAAHDPAQATPYFLEDLASARKTAVDAAMRHLRSLPDLPRDALRALADHPKPGARRAARELLDR